jgi:TolB protein
MAAAPHLQPLTRRRAVLTGAAAGIGTVAAFGAGPARAVLHFDLNQGNVQPMPIALPDFLAGSPSDGGSARGISQIITANLRGSGLFSPIDQTPLNERINFDQQPPFADWGALSAQALVTGRVTRQPDGRIKAEFRLWDVSGKVQLDGQLYFSTPDNLRRVAHIISDRIYERLTGEKGYFDSRIVFVDESGPKDRRIKRLAMMDQDGAGVRYLTNGGDLVATPHFSRSTQEITYLSFGQGETRVYLFNTETQQREIVGNFPGMTSSPHLTPDGQRVIMSLQQGTNSNLFVMDLRSKATTRLTDTAAIDTAPKAIRLPYGRRAAISSRSSSRLRAPLRSALWGSTGGTNGSSPKASTMRGRPSPPTVGSSCSSDPTAATQGRRSTQSISLAATNRGCRRRAMHPIRHGRHY